MREIFLIFQSRKMSNVDKEIHIRLMQQQRPLLFSFSLEAGRNPRSCSSNPTSSVRDRSQSHHYSDVPWCLLVLRRLLKNTFYGSMQFTKELRGTMEHPNNGEIAKNSRDIEIYLEVRM